MNSQLVKRLNLIAIILYLGAVAVGLFTRFSVWSILIYAVIFDLVRMMIISRGGKENSSQEKPKDRFILLTILGLAIVLQRFTHDIEAIVLVAFIFSQFLRRIFPQTELFSSPAIENMAQKPSPSRFAGLTTVLLFTILIFDLAIALFDSPYEIWNIWLVPLFGFMGMDWLEKNFQQSLLRIKSLMLIIFFLSAFFYLGNYKMLWPTSFSKSYYGLSERPVNTLIEGGWDWGSRHLRFEANPEEVEKIVQSYTCGKTINGRYDSYPCLEKDSNLAYKKVYWYEPYTDERPRQHWYLPDSIKTHLPVNIYYDSVDQIVEIFEMTEM